MRRNQAGPILDKRTNAQPWAVFNSSEADAPKVHNAELLLKSFPDAARSDAIEDVGTAAIRVWRDFPESLSDESPDADVQQEKVELQGTKTGATATAFLVFHKGELWLASERFI
jgi:hypothetical protein